eukprot:4736523-Alexandrium_andersonii.AAC.1
MPAGFKLQSGHLAAKTGDGAGGSQLLLHGTRIGMPVKVAHGSEGCAHGSHDSHKHARRGEVLQDT